MDPEAYFDSPAVHSARPISLPESVREARGAAAGLAGFGLAYPVLIGLIAGDEVARSAALQFGCSWILGVAVFALGRGPLIRRAVIGLAILQVVAVLRVHVQAVPGVVGLIVVLFTLGASATIVCHLRRPEAKAWFDIRVAAAA